MTASPLAAASRERDRASDASFRPRLFCRALEADRQALDALLAGGSVLFVHDTLSAQIEELLETRAPGRRIARVDLAAQAALHAGPVPEDYGTWAYYGWSGRLVHVLPRGEYEELRTSRNRNKITRREQTELGHLRVGVAGLSVGQATAVTLALEGVGGMFRLGDFDTLSLSNMNRLRAGVHSLGVNKAVLAAREIAEINPYAEVEVFARGIEEDSIDAFLTSGGPLDLVFEECDDLKIKIRLRQEARRRGIAVLMETSDRGLLDIERFDREPERPLFHGLIPAVDPAEVAGLTAAEKIPIILGIVGRDTMSPRLAASLVDVDATLKTWPQLASAVALGGAINTDAARRIALGKLVTSGRFFVDLEEIIQDAPAPSGPAATSSAGDASPSSRPPSKDAGGAGAGTRGLEATPQELALGPKGPLSGPSLERLIELGTRAPSGGNVQPWRFTYGAGGTLRVWHDEVRSRSFLDFEDRASHFAFGALAETLRLAAGRLRIGLSPLRAYPDPAVPGLVCEAALGGAPERLSAEDQRFAACIEERVTTRRVSRRDPLAPSDLAALESTARGSGAELHVLVEPEALAVLGEILGAGDRLRLLSPIMHREMMGEIRWSKEHANATRDGLDLQTLGLRPSDEAALHVVANPTVTRALREVGGGQGLARSAREAIAGASAVGLVRMPMAPRESGATPAPRSAYFAGGIAATRVWLHATSVGIAFQPMTALLYLFARLDAGGTGLDSAAKTELEELRGRYHSLFPMAPGASDVLLFRMIRADPATPRSLRRTVAEVLTVVR